LDIEEKKKHRSFSAKVCPSSFNKLFLKSRRRKLGIFKKSFYFFQKRLNLTERTTTLNCHLLLFYKNSLFLVKK